MPAIQNFPLIVSFLLLFVYPEINAQQNASTGNCNLELLINSVKKRDGNFFIAIYNQPKGFRSPEYAYRTSIIAVKENKQQVVFKDLPKGTYAIAVFQDWNGNQTLDLNWVGVPTEPYGFSNNPKLLFGPPGFEQCAFSLITESLQIQIDLK